MRIPEAVRISGVEYRIGIAEVLTDGVHELAGQIRYSERDIRISAKACRSEAGKGLTLWHEIIHGILEDRGLELEDDTEEAVCEAVARGVYQILEDNAGRFFDLQDEAGETHTGRPDKFARHYAGRWGPYVADPDEREAGYDDNDDKERSER